MTSSSSTKQSLITAETAIKNRFDVIKQTLKDSKEEIIHILDWTWPILISNILNNVVYLFVNMVFVGHLGKDELAAVALGNTWQFSTAAISIGILNAMDTLISQSYGAKNYQLIGITAQRATVVSLACCLLISFLWFFTKPILIGIHQDVHVSILCEQYTIGMLPGLWFGTFLNIAQKYLQGQGIMKPSIVVGVILNIINAILNFILVHGVGSNGGLGVIGSSLATSFSKMFGFFALLGWIYFFKLHLLPVRTWYGFSRDALSLEGLKEFLSLGIPAGMQMMFEGCGFEVLTILAGLFGPTSIDAHSIAMNFTLMTFMLPLSLSIALSVRIGQLLGSKKPDLARRSTRVGFGISITFMLLISAVQFTSRNVIGSLYSTDTEVRQMVGKLLPISALFQIFDGFQTTCQGIIRGIGRQKIGAVVNFTAFYLVGIPMSSVLAFAVMHNIYGLWWGLCCGLSANALILGFVVMRIDWNEEMRKALERTSSISKLDQATPQQLESDVKELISPDDERSLTNEDELTIKDVDDDDELEDDVDDDYPDGATLTTYNNININNNNNKKNKLDEIV